MTIYKTGGLVVICAGAAMLMATLPAQAGNAGVNIIYPPKLASDFDKSDEKTAKTVITKSVKVKVIVGGKLDITPGWRSFYKWRRRHEVDRALFQNYPSDRTRYSGRLYPF